MSIWGLNEYSSFERLEIFIINSAFKLDNSSCHGNINNGLTQMDIFADPSNLPVHGIFYSWPAIPFPVQNADDVTPFPVPVCAAKKFRAAMFQFFLATWTGVGATVDIYFTWNFTIF